MVVIAVDAVTQRWSGVNWRQVVHVKGTGNWVSLGSQEIDQTEGGGTIA